MTELLKRTTLKVLRIDECELVGYLSDEIRNKDINCDTYLEYKSFYEKNDENKAKDIDNNIHFKISKQIKYNKVTKSFLKRNKIYKKSFSFNP
jgi:hypothetical protein